MARPQKSGLDYFPLDCDMDEKVGDLETMHGILGFGVYVKCLQALYRTDAGELLLDEIRKKSLAHRAYLTLKKWEGVMADAVRIGLFDAEAYAKGVLLSHGVKKRLQLIQEERDKARVKKRRRTDNPDFSGVPDESFPQGKPPENPGENPGFPPDNAGDSSPENLRTTRERKGKERKEEEKTPSDPPPIGASAPPATAGYERAIAAEIDVYRQTIQAAYPGLDLDREIKAAALWQATNPDKVRESPANFFRGWMRRSFDALEKSRKAASNAPALQVLA